MSSEVGGFQNQAKALQVAHQISLGQVGFTNNDRFIEKDHLAQKPCLEW